MYLNVFVFVGVKNIISMKLSIIKSNNVHRDWCICDCYIIIICLCPEIKSYYLIIDCI